MRITAFVLAVALSVVSNLGCSRSSLLDDGLTPGGSATPPSASGSQAPPSTGGGGHHEGEGPSDAGADLDGTISAQDDGRVSTSEDAPSPKVCNSSTCPGGCCLGDGTCFVNLPSADGSFPTGGPCGTRGEACVTCPSGDTCPTGACQHDTSGACSPENCNGCCFSEQMSLPGGGISGTSHICFEGWQNDYCGSGGTQCQGCSPAMNGGHCVANPGSGGHCEGIGTCNATNCDGCCAGGLCVVGTQNIGCGAAGAACQDCTQDGGLCINGQTLDGGPYNVCGYGCLMTSEPYGCNVLCKSTMDCFNATDWASHQ